MTLLDVFDVFETIQVCVAYELDGEIVDTVPARADQLARARPIYERLARLARHRRSMPARAEDLPDRALDYLGFIEDQIGVPVSLVGVGPGREQIVPLATAGRSHA